MQAHGTSVQPFAIGHGQGTLAEIVVGRVFLSGSCSPVRACRFTVVSHWFAEHIKSDCNRTAKRSAVSYPSYDIAKDSQKWQAAIACMTSTVKYDGCTDCIRIRNTTCIQIDSTCQNVFGHISAVHDLERSHRRRFRCMLIFGCTIQHLHWEGEISRWVVQAA